MRVLFLILLSTAAWAQSFSDPVPDSTRWRDATPRERNAFVKGLRVGMATDPLYLTRSETDLEALIATFYSNRSNLQSAITAAFGTANTRSLTTSQYALELPPPPAIPLPQPNREPLAGLGQSQAANDSRTENRSNSPLPATFNVGNGVTAPRLIYKVEPDYSEQARNAHIQGVVVLYVEVNELGETVNARVVRSIGYGLDQRAIEAVDKWKFQPGFNDGKPVRVAATIEVNFRLLDNPPGARQGGLMACTFSAANCVRITAPVGGQMVQLSDTQFVIFDGKSWRMADVH